VLAYKDAAGVRLISRNGRDLTRRFLELAVAVGDLELPTLVLDGELAVFDRLLVSRFEWLRGRPKDETATLPAHGLRLPLRAREGSPEAGAEGTPDRARGACRRPAVRAPGAPAANGLEAWAQVLARGYEGLVGKDEASAYVEGGHSPGSK
jgi:bifunctional non-homologous end joining protein LigD